MENHDCKKHFPEDYLNKMQKYDDSKQGYVIDKIWYVRFYIIFYFSFISFLIRPKMERCISCKRYVWLNEMSNHLASQNECSKGYDTDKIEFFKSFAEKNPPE